MNAPQHLLGITRDEAMRTDLLDTKIFNSFIETNTLIIFLIIPLELTHNQ